MNVLLYAIGKQPNVISIEENNSTFENLIGGKVKVLPIVNELFIVYDNDHNKKESIKRKAHNMNRIITIPDIKNGRIAEMKRKAINGDFFVCQMKKGDYVDLQTDKIFEVMALCGN